MIAESESDMITQSSRSEGTGNPKLLEELSNFGDDACGEPALPQHLVLDFTPDPKVDNEIVQKKICDFWAFINSVPEIQHLMVKPERVEAPTPTETSIVKSSALDIDATALSMLEAIEQKGLITRTFEAKLPQTYCPLSSSGSHKSEESDGNYNDIQQKNIRKHVSSIKSSRYVSSKPCPDKKPVSLEAKILCKKLEEWDKKNPKSMEPPGHPPTLQHCVIQRQVFES